jgi:hypothetical protein
MRLVCVLAMLIAVPALAQRGRGAAGPPPTAQATAPIDITGYWVSVVTEDWRYRMITPNKGDYPSIPLNPAGRQVADAWDPAKDEAAGNQCKAYGAAGVIRLPGRLHVTWADDNTMRVETESGTQTRLFHFGQAPSAPESPWQGVSIAQWQPAGGGRRGGPGGGGLKVVTTKMKSGYLQKNGVPYSENAVLTEYYELTKEPNGDQWLIVVAVIEDPQYLNARYIRSTNFKKLANGSDWKPNPCSAR